MEKLKLPNKITIGGLHYKVIYPYEFRSDPTCYGLHSGETGSIRVRDAGKNMPTLEAFLHELLHGVDFVYTNHSISEMVVGLNARAWLQVLLDNELFLHTDEIPKSIRVGCYRYQIQFPDRFVDRVEDVSAITNTYPELTMSINDTSDGVETTDEFRKVCLIYCVQLAIAYTSFEELEDDGSINAIKSRNNAQGIFQVFRDNKIDKIIKKYGER